MTTTIGAITSHYLKCIKRLTYANIAAKLQNNNATFGIEFMIQQQVPTKCSMRMIIAVVHFFITLKLQKLS